MKAMWRGQTLTIRCPQCQSAADLEKFLETT